MAYYDEAGNLVSTASPAPAATVVAGAGSDGGDSSGWLSGLGDLFQGIGAGIGSGLRAANVPTPSIPSGWVYNPSTGGYYNPATGQALTSTGTLTSQAGLVGGLGSNSFLIIVIVVVAFLIFKRG